MNEEEMKQILLSHCKECHLREYTSCVECEENFTKATNTALNLIDKLQKENENYKELVLVIKEKLNNIAFEVEQAWRKIEKLENKDERNRTNR